MLVLILAVVCGCAPSATRRGATSDVAVTHVTEAMVGKWGTDGDVSLLVSRVGDRIIFAAPENDTWRTDIGEAQIEGQSVCFVQKNFLHSGEEHPFNGVECNTRIKLIDADTMEMKMTTVHSPNLEAERLTRIE